MFAVKVTIPFFSVKVAVPVTLLSLLMRIQDSIDFCFQQNFYKQLPKEIWNKK